MPPLSSMAAVVQLPELFAYLDPGTGSFVLQLLLAGVLSGLYGLKHYWMRLKMLALRLPKTNG